ELARALGSFTTQGGGSVLAVDSLKWAISGVTETFQGQDYIPPIDPAAALDYDKTWKIVIDDSSYLVARQQSDRFGMSLTMFVPSSNVDQPLATYRRWLIAMSVASIIIVLAFSFSIHRIIQRPLRSLIYS